MGAMSRVRAAAIGNALSLAVLAMGCGSSSGPKSAAVPWDALHDSSFLIGSSQQTGDYVGRLVSLPCTLQKSDADKMQCDASGRRPALVVTNDSVVHPLLANELSIRQKLESPQYQGKQVRVTGILYPDLKAIFVGDITLYK